jgi:hypothetical protein
MSRLGPERESLSIFSVDHRIRRYLGQGGGESVKKEEEVLMI